MTWYIHLVSADREDYVGPGELEENLKMKIVC